MAGCIPLSREMLRDPIDIGVADVPLDFARARTIAEARPARRRPTPCSWPGMTRAPADFRPR